MKVFLVFAIAIGVLTAHSAEEPSKIIVECRSKIIGNVSYQIYGDLTIDGLKLLAYIAIDTKNPDVKPVVRKNEKWNIDTTYQPTKKYKDYNRYIIQENTYEQDGLAILIPTKTKVYNLAKEKSQSSGQTLVQAEFEAILRSEDDFGDDAGGQEYLTCGTGWLKF